MKIRTSFVSNSSSSSFIVISKKNNESLNEFVEYYDKVSDKNSSFEKFNVRLNQNLEFIKDMFSRKIYKEIKEYTEKNDIDMYMGEIEYLDDELIEQMKKVKNAKIMYYSADDVIDEDGWASELVNLSNSQEEDCEEEEDDDENDEDNDEEYDYEEDEEEMSNNKLDMQCQQEAESKVQDMRTPIFNSMSDLGCGCRPRYDLSTRDMVQYLIGIEKYMRAIMEEVLYVKHKIDKLESKLEEKDKK